MARGTDSGGVFASAHLDLAKGDEPRGVLGELRAGRAGVGVLHAPSRVHLGGRCGTLGRTRARRPCSRGREVEPPSRRARGDARRSRNAPKVARAGMAPAPTGSDPSLRRAGRERRTCFDLPSAAKNFHLSTGVTTRKKKCDIFQRPEIKLAAIRDMRRPAHRNFVFVANRARLMNVGRHVPDSLVLAPAYPRTHHCSNGAPGAAGSAFAAFSSSAISPSFSLHPRHPTTLSACRASFAPGMGTAPLLAQ